MVRAQAACAKPSIVRCTSSHGSRRVCTSAPLVSERQRPGSDHGERSVAVLRPRGFTPSGRSIGAPQRCDHELGYVAVFGCCCRHRQNPYPPVFPHSLATVVPTPVASSLCFLPSSRSPDPRPPASRESPDCSIQSPYADAAPVCHGSARSRNQPRTNALDLMAGTSRRILLLTTTGFLAASCA